MTSFYICGNDETICDGYTDDRTQSWRREIGNAFVEAAAGVLRNAGGDYEVVSNFRDWHGGRFDQFYQRCGLVAIATDAPPEIESLAWKAEAAGSQARDAYVAELEAMADRFAADAEAEAE